MSNSGFILSEPSCGWCDFGIGDIGLDGISYLSEPHFEMIDAFTDYLDKGMGLARVDCESNGIIGIVFNEHGVAITDVLEEYADEDEALYEAKDIEGATGDNGAFWKAGRKEILGEARELLYNITDALDKWMLWAYDVDDREFYEESEFLKDRLRIFAARLHREGALDDKSLSEENEYLSRFDISDYV